MIFLIDNHTKTAIVDFVTANGGMMNYNIKTIRNAGLEAKWTRTRNGAPIIAGRLDKGSWYVIDNSMWESAKKIGILEAFKNHTALGKFFSIQA